MRSYGDGSSVYSIIRQSFIQQSVIYKFDFSRLLKMNMTQKLKVYRSLAHKNIGGNTPRQKILLLTD